jgi:hypothetical protein
VLRLSVMPSPPYRVPAPRPPEPPPLPVDEATKLGVVRSVHVARPIWSWLLRPALLAGSLAYLGFRPAYELARAYSESGRAPEFGQSVFPALAFLAAGAALGYFSAEPLRLRGLRIELHAFGIVVARRRSRDVVFFEDVDEVWLQFAPVSVHMLIDALTLIDRHGKKHRVPMQVTDASLVASWITQSCSAPLFPEARKALDAGEELTFARMRFDRDAIAFGNKRVKWSEFRLVRLLPGRVVFFRGMPVFPWRTVKLDAVPHPTVFESLVRECARKATKIEDTVMR